MPYNFTFDLSKLPCCFYIEINRISQRRKHQKTYLKNLRDLILRYKIQEGTVLALSDAIILLADLINLQKINTIERSKFLQAKDRALFLPHCSRKYMDYRCKAIFDRDIPAYVCNHCSPDCIVNKADQLAKGKGYDIYVLPGGSCIPKILEAHRYEGIVGVACGEELKNIAPLLKKFKIAGQAMPLIKNGCSNTLFNIDALIDIL